MNILLAINDRYIEPAVVLLTSLFENNPCPIWIIILESDVSVGSKARLCRLVQEYGNHIRFVTVDENIFCNAPERENITAETYYRLLAFELLPEIHKVLYLDVDIIVTHSLDKLWNTDMSSYCVAGVKDAGEVQGDLYHRAQLGLDKTTPYINGGLLLLNLDNIRRKITVKEIKKYIYDNSGILWYQDQDVVNVLFEDSIRVLPETYNYTPIFDGRSDVLRYILCRNKKMLPIIIHYFGALKPWYFMYGHKYLSIYGSYVKRTDCKWLKRRIRVNQIIRPIALIIQVIKMLSFDSVSFNKKKRTRELWYYWNMRAGDYADYLVSKGISKIIVYGFGRWGKAIIHEICGSKVEVLCVVDKYSDDKPKDLRLIRPNELEHFKGNVIIVAVQDKFDEIAEELERFDMSNVISLEDFVYQFI